MGVQEQIIGSATVNHHKPYCCATNSFMHAPCAGFHELGNGMPPRRCRAGALSILPRRIGGIADLKLTD